VAPGALALALVEELEPELGALATLVPELERLEELELRLGPELALRRELEYWLE
jgi:hypothetical protein